jgi:hypothetical protein
LQKNRVSKKFGIRILPKNRVRVFFGWTFETEFSFCLCVTIGCCQEVGLGVRPSQLLQFEHIFQSKQMSKFWLLTQGKESLANKPIEWNGYMYYFCLHTSMYFIKIVHVHIDVLEASKSPSFFVIFVPIFKKQLL